MAEIVVVLTCSIYFFLLMKLYRKKDILTMGQHIIPKSILKKMRVRDSLELGLCSCFLVPCLEINVFDVSALYNLGCGSVFRRLLILPWIYSSPLGKFGWN